MNALATPDQQLLKDMFVFNDNSGELSRKNGKFVGKATGSGGYLRVRIAGTQYKIHRIVWKMLFGEDAQFEIDHIDGNKTNNRPTNLRQVEKHQNLWNAPVSKNSKSRIKGVSSTKKGNKWRAQVESFGHRHVKSFQSIDEAHLWVKMKRQELHHEFAHH